MQVSEFRSGRCQLLQALAVLVCLAAAYPVAQAPPTVPKIWDDAALADWATPLAALRVRPSLYSAAEYYSAPADN